MYYERDNAMQQYGISNIDDERRKQNIIKAFPIPFYEPTMVFALTIENTIIQYLKKSFLYVNIKKNVRMGFTIGLEKREKNIQN